MRRIDGQSAGLSRCPQRRRGMPKPCWAAFGVISRCFRSPAGRGRLGPGLLFGVGRASSSPSVRHRGSFFWHRGGSTTWRQRWRVYRGDGDRLESEFGHPAIRYQYPRRRIAVPGSQAEKADGRLATRVVRRCRRQVRGRRTQSTAAVRARRRGRSPCRARCLLIYDAFQRSPSGVANPDGRGGAWDS